MRRATAAVPFCIATGLLLCGCGGSGGTAAGSAPLSKAQAISYAHMVNLRASDVPGMTETAPEGTESEGRSGEELRRCVGLGPERGIASIHSASFKGSEAVGYEQVRSSVTVQPTVALANQSIAAAASARGRACVARFAQRRYSGEGSGGVNIGQVAATPLQVPTDAGFKSAGLRVAIHATVTRGGTTVPFTLYLDVLAFVNGPAEVSLVTQGAPQPFPQASQARLLSTLMSRAANLPSQ